MFGDLDWRWIAIGVAIMFGLNLIASLILVPLIGDSLPATATIRRMLLPRSVAGSWPWAR